MLIYNTTKTPVAENATEIEEEVVYEGYVDPTLGGLQEFLAESTDEIYTVNSAIYISDILMEQAVLEGEEAEPLLESFTSTTWEKLKKIFNDLKTKIIAWYKQAIQRMNTYIQHGAKFIQTYEKELNDKDATGFKYTGYVYDISAGDAAFQAANNKVGKFLDSLGLDFTNTSVENQADALQKTDNGKGLDEAKSDLINDLGGKSVSDVLDNVLKSYRGGASEPKEIDNFSGNSKAEMIETVKSGKSIIGDMQKANAEAANQMNTVLKAIDKARATISKGADEQTKASLTALASKKYQAAHYAVNISNQLAGTTVKAFTEIVKSYESTLKTFLRWKPTKENVEVVTPHETTVDTVFESAVKWL